MNTFRSRAMALCATLVFCLQFLCPPQLVHAQTAPPAPTSTGFTAETTTTQVGGVPPSTGLSPLPEKGTVTPEMQSGLTSNAVTQQGTNVIDVSKQATPGTLNFSGSNLVNDGHLYLWSSDHSIGTAIINADNIFNRGTISTILPANIFATLSNPVANLSLTLQAAQAVVNSGTISSAANLTVNAGTSIINALPTSASATMPAPVMQAVNNLNLTALSGNIVNSGLMESINSNINIVSSLQNNLVVNNVNGTLQALNGSINVRDSLFTGKFNTAILGGDVLAQQLNAFSGSGILEINVNKLTPTLSLLAGDVLVNATNSNVSIASLIATGDPLVNSGGDLLFKSEEVDGVKTGICIVDSGSYSAFGRAYVEPGVNLITGGSFNIDVGSSIDLTVPLSSTGTVGLKAGSNIKAVGIGAGTLIMQSGADIQTGGISTQTFVQATANGAIRTDSISAPGGVILQANKTVFARSIDTSSAFGRAGAVDIKSNMDQTGASSFKVGGASDNGVLQTIRADSGGFSSNPVTFVAVRDFGTGGIEVAQNAISVLAAQQQGSSIVLDAPRANITLAESLSALGPTNGAGGNIVINAKEVHTNGTTLTTDGGASGGRIWISASKVAHGAGDLNLHADSQLFGGDIRLVNAGAMQISTSVQQGNVFSLSVDTRGPFNSPIVVEGTGATNISANGKLIGGFIAAVGTNVGVQGDSPPVGPPSPAGPLSITANGTGVDAFGGSIFISSQSFSNFATASTLAANGTGTGDGGEIEVEAIGASSDLLVGSGAGKMSVSGTGGSGGTVQLTAGHAVHVGGASSIAVNAIAPGGNGGHVTLLGGGSGAAPGGGVLFDGQAAIHADGNGTGSGGNILLVARSADSNVVVGQASNQGTLTASGGVLGRGGQVVVRSAHDLTVDGSAISVKSGGNNNGGLISLEASGTGTLSVGGTLAANGAGTGGGGIVEVRGSTIRLNDGTKIEANGGTTASGTSSGGGISLVSLSSVSALSIGSAVDQVSIEAKGNGAYGGTIRVVNAGDINIGAKGSIDASAAGADGKGGVIVFTQPTNVFTQGVVNNGVITANAAKHENLGGIVFNDTNEPVPVSVSGSGKFEGQIIARGSDVKITSTGAAANLTLRAVQILQQPTGNIDVSASGAGSRIELMPVQGVDQAFLIAGNDITLRADRIDLGVSADGASVAGTGGTVVAVNGSVNIATNSTSNGDIRIANDLGASKNVSISAHGTGNIVQLGSPSEYLFAYAAPIAVTLSTQQGNIGTNSRPVHIEGAASVSANTAQPATAVADAAKGIFLTVNSDQTKAFNLLASATENTFQLRSNSDITVAAPLHADIVDIKTVDSGDIRISSTVTGDQSISLVAGDLITQDSMNVANIFMTNSTAQLIGKDVVLATRIGNMGTSLLPINMQAEGLSFETTLQGSVFVKELDGLSVKQSKIGTGGNLFLELSGALTQEEGSTVTVSGTSVTLIDHFGSLGVSSVKPFVFKELQDSAQLDLSIRADNGGAFIQIQTPPLARVVLHDIDANQPINGPLFLNTNHALSVGSIYTNGFIALQTTGGSLDRPEGASLQVRANSTIVAHNGSNITLNVEGVPSSNNFITIGFGSKILTPEGGAIHIWLGADSRFNTVRYDDSGLPPMPNVSFVAPNRPAVDIYLGAPVPTFEAFNGLANTVAAYSNDIVINPGDPNLEQARSNGITLAGGVLIQSGTAPKTALLPPGKQDGPPPGQAGTSPGQAKITPGQSNGTASPLGQIFIHPGQEVRPSNLPTPPGQELTPPGQQKKLAFLDESEGHSEAVVVPVAFISGASRIGGCERWETECATLWCEGNPALIRSQNADFVLRRGKLVLSCRKNMLIGLPHGGTVSAKEGTVCLIEVDDGQVAVRVLDEAHRSPARLRLCGQNVEMSAGTELSYCAEHGQISDQLPKRAIKIAQLGKLQVRTAEISLPALLATEKILSALRNSKSPHETAVMNRLLKTAACIMIVQGKHGPYKAVN